jgi:opacity protein-like surface antigen
MKRMLLVVLAALVAAPLAAQQARPGLSEAQTPPLRHGFYFQLGLGGGMEQLNLDNDQLGYSDPLWAFTLNARGGYTFSQAVRLGVDFNSWIRPDGPVTETASSVMPNLQIYPVRNAGFYIRGGGGYAWSSISDNSYYYSSITYGGAGTNLGVGWEIPVSHTVALTPTFDWYQYWIDNGMIGSYTERILSFGLAVTFQTH